METASGGFRHNKREQSVELQIKRSSCYDDFAFKAATTLNLKPLPCSSIRLFKVCGGAIILDEDIVVQGKTRRWTVGSNLSLLKKNSSSVKIGVSYVIESVHTNDSSGFSISLPSSGILDKQGHGHSTPSSSVSLSTRLGKRHAWKNVISQVN